MAGNGYYSHTAEAVNFFIVVCPLCGSRVRFDAFMELWTLLGEELASRARISMPAVHTCAKQPDGTFTTRDSGTG